MQLSPGLFAALVVLAAARLPAQGPGLASGSGASPACLDSISASKLTRVPVYATVKMVDSGGRRMRSNAEILLQEIVSRVREILGAPVDRLPMGEPAVTWRGLAAPLTVTMHRDGRITRAFPADRGDTAAAALLARALDTVPQESKLLDWSVDSLSNSVTFRVDLDWPTVEPNGKSTPPRVTSVALAIFSVAHPWEKLVARRSDNRRPIYPDTPRVLGFGASVIMQFVVDTSGRAEPATVRDLPLPADARLNAREMEQYKLFVQSVRRAVVQMTFYPAEIGGCKVRQLAQMPFEFTLRQ